MLLVNKYVKDEKKLIRLSSISIHNYVCWKKKQYKRAKKLREAIE